MLRISRDAMCRLVKDADDPLPIRFSHAPRLEFCLEPMSPSDARHALGPKVETIRDKLRLLSRMMPLRI